MKKIFLELVLLGAWMGVLPGAASAADPLQVAPEMYKLKFENEKVRVMEVTFKPGAKIAAHSHPDHFVVVKAAGQLKISKPDGSSAVAELKNDEVMWIAAETHWAENVGKTQITLLVTELKVR